MTNNEFIELLSNFDEDADTIINNNTNINVETIKNIKSTLCLIAKIIFKSSPNAKIYYNFNNFKPKNIVEVQIETDDSDWFETSSENFIDIIKNADKYSVEQIPNERLKMELHFEI